MSARSQWQAKVVDTLARIHEARGDVHPEIAPALVQVQAYQRRRLTQTYADFLADAETTPAARFFLDELYSTAEVAEQRDADVQRIVPLMAKVLPQVALDAVGDALTLDSLSAELDYDMAQAHAARGAGQKEVTAARYGELYRAVGKRAMREEQLALLARTGQTLAKAVRVPLIGPTLSMMEMPARAAGLMRLHSFLAHGLAAFKRLPDVQHFLRTIGAREAELMKKLFTGEE